ncbi:hypothetical protein pb186bvf_004650 [Paramecium bursaria]
MQNNNKSHVSITVGPHFEGHGKWHAHVHANVSTQSANELLTDLQARAPKEVDLEWAFVAQFSSPAPQELADAITASAAIHNDLKDKVIKVQVHEQSVWVSFKLDNEGQAEITENFNMFFGQGLDQLAQTQTNEIHLKVSSDQDWDTFFQLIAEKERIVSALLKSLKFQLIFDLHPQLAESVKAIVENFDPEFANEPPLILFKKFKQFKLDLDFKSSEEFPEYVRKNVLESRKLQTYIDEGSAALLLQNHPEYEKAWNAFGSDVHFYLVVPNFLSVKAHVNAPGLGQVIRSYGKGIAKIL